MRATSSPPSISGSSQLGPSRRSSGIRMDEDDRGDQRARHVPARLPDDSSSAPGSPATMPVILRRRRQRRPASRSRKSSQSGARRVWIGGFNETSLYGLAHPAIGSRYSSGSTRSEPSERPGRPRRLDRRFAPMMQLEVFGESALMARVAESLIERDGVSRVRCVDAAQAGHAVVTAGVRPRSVDPVLDDLRRLGVKAPDTVLTRVEVVDWAASTRPEVSLVLADVLGQAWLNARPVARYLALMVVAGVIASYGVIETNTILIVGAMAVSPDLLPITAIGVGILGRRLPTRRRGLADPDRRAGRRRRRRGGERGGPGRFRPDLLRVRPRLSLGLVLRSDTSASRQSWWRRGGRGGNAGS